MISIIANLWIDDDILSRRPYYHGWVFNKVSTWREIINNHVLLLDQVILMSNSQYEYIFFQSGMLRKNHKELYAFLESASGFHPEDDLEALGPEHFILPTAFLLAGLFAAFLVFLGEILVKKYQDKNTGAHY